MSGVAVIVLAFLVLVETVVMIGLIGRVNRLEGEVSWHEMVLGHITGERRL